MNRKTVSEEIKKILLHEWDPIGVKTFVEADDEYDMYINPIYEMLLSGKDEVDIYNYLRWVVIDNIGLNGNEQLERVVADKILQLKQ
ncbi:hypothetical protein FCH31_16510 [Lelliottia amnigena]|jgi:hypothetical protein|uniref:hypothetical protein n=1 Tax=Lelliottia amnigena TaxID=61646 RepID=UPI0015759B1B|nr:hypothetical protein [Lelliottia amnigena]NTX71008.1 hypothetical protein [Lelliottia amnigena]